MIKYLEQKWPEMKKAVVMENRNEILFNCSNFNIFFNCWKPVNNVMIDLVRNISLKTYRITTMFVVNP